MGEVLGSAHIEEGQISRCHLHEERHSCANSEGPLWYGEVDRAQQLVHRVLALALAGGDGGPGWSWALVQKPPSSHPRTPKLLLHALPHRTLLRTADPEEPAKVLFLDSTLEVSGHSVKET